jgi:hypothetical protein
MRADRLKARIEANKPLIVELPPDPPPGDVDVIVLYAETSSSPKPFASLTEFHAWLCQQPPSGRSRKEIDQELASERDSWD